MPDKKGSILESPAVRRAFSDASSKCFEAGRACHTTKPELERLQASGWRRLQK